jgi:hypothetical protein
MFAIRGTYNYLYALVIIKFIKDKMVQTCFFCYSIITDLQKQKQYSALGKEALFSFAKTETRF